MIKDNFSNQEMDLQQLPQIQSLEKNSLSDKYALLNLRIHIAVVLTMLLLGSAVYLQPFFTLPTKFSPVLTYLLLAVFVLGLLLGWYNYQADSLKSYTLRELDLHYNSGLFFRKTVSQPISRIQHIELKRGPIERKTGLATLQVFSAGGAMHTFEIPGLHLAIAQQLRQFILEHKEVTKNG